MSHLELKRVWARRVRQCFGETSGAVVGTIQECPGVCCTGAALAGWLELRKLGGAFLKDSRLG